MENHGVDPDVEVPQRPQDHAAGRDPQLDEAITLGTLVAFTTLQARLFFPIGSLLGVSVDVQSSFALFDRVFEYLDEDVDIEEGTRELPRPPAGRITDAPLVRQAPARPGSNPVVLPRFTPHALGARRRG